MEKSLFAKPHRMGIVVRDMDKTVRFYQSLDAGPFFPELPINMTKRFYHAKISPPGGSKVKAMIGNMGIIRLQLLQPVEGQSMFQEFLDERGEGVHHYAFLVDDIEKVEAALIKKGTRILSSARLAGGGGHVIIDSAKIGGIFIEFMQPPVEWLEGFPPLLSA
jgi:methylmalonyl-CoA/ethylmalonyl-CoA epimerase